MKLRLGYGTGEQELVLPDRNIMDVLYANDVPHKAVGQDAVKAALAHPLGTGPLREQDLSGKRIAVIVSDISRPVPSYEFMPLLLDELYAAGAEPGNITVVFALGSHRGHSPEERRKLVGGRCFREVRCVDSDPADCIRLGVTAAGTPVDITRAVAEADYRISTGNVEFHYFAGYSGGYKAIMPGVSTPEAIQRNHRMMLREGAAAGRIEGNPIREDIEEAGRICGLNFILNVVLDEHKHIVHAAAGDPVKAHRDACACLDRMYRKPVPGAADIVIVSQGGAPKDANLYQSQKALANAGLAVRPGGTVILAGACQEGLGSKVFEEWLLGAESPEALAERIRHEFRLGGHKAAAIGRLLTMADIMLVSELPEDLVRNIFMIPMRSVQEAAECAMKRHGEDASVLVMPFGGATLPVIR